MPLNQFRSRHSTFLSTLRFNPFTISKLRNTNKLRSINKLPYISRLLFNSKSLTITATVEFSPQ